MNKNKKYQFLELLCIFIITLIFNLVFNTLTNDEVWNYGFAYNISRGLIPYKDFNMVITPLYPMINALFMIIFGKNILIMHIINAILCTAIFYFLKKTTSKAYYILYSILLFFALPNYNIMCLLFLYILIMLEKQKSNDYLIGIILGLTFMTKQNVGIYLCIPTIFTKDIKRILKRIIGFMIPNILIFTYLIYNKAVYEFINYCFLGLSNFGEKNFGYYKTTTIILIISIAYLIYEYIKTKNTNILYLIVFWGISYPIIDPYHIVLPLIPTFGCLLNNMRLNKRIISCAFIIFIVFISIFNYVKYYKTDYTYPNATRAYKYRKINNLIAKQINITSDYISSSDKYTFIIDSNAYLIKLNADMIPNKYDLLLNGNMGKSGDIGIINEFSKLCSREKCTFILNKQELKKQGYNQYPVKIHNYIISNYKEDSNLLGFTIYNNYYE